jgi:hypothetical protein
VNKFVLLQNNLVSKQINIPVELSWDLEGLDDALDQYEQNAVEEVIGKGYDFEVNRFPHSKHEESDRTDLNYEFNFFSGGSLEQSSNWINSYLGEGFTPQEVFYYSNKFIKSYFKLDFYDTVDDKRQKNYFTVIIPTQQGFFQSTNMSRTSVEIRRPSFKLDYIGDKEGFFLYWLKSLKFVPINTFYMTAKFYNAATGQFYRLMNQPQSIFTNSTFGSNVYNFDYTQYFYYRVVLDYIDLSYRVYNIEDNSRVGTTTPIKWFEYVNPPQQ